MELTETLIRKSLDDALTIFKEKNIGIVDNEVEIEFIDGEKFINDAMEN